MKKTIKKIIASVLAVNTLAVGVIGMSANALSPNGKQFYIPKSCSSTASETASGNYDIFSFKVTEILNANKQSCNYKRIRIKAKSNSSSTQWLSGTGFTGSTGCTVLSGNYNSTMTFQAYKGTYCEIVPSTFSSATYSFYYYGNDPDLAAYATIESDCA